MHKVVYNNLPWKKNDLSHSMIGGSDLTKKYTS